MDFCLFTIYVFFLETDGYFIECGFKKCYNTRFALEDGYSPAQRSRVRDGPDRSAGREGVFQWRWELNFNLWRKKLAGYSFCILRCRGKMGENLED